MANLSSCYDGDAGDGASKATAPGQLPRGLLEVTSEQSAEQSATAIRQALEGTSLGVPIDLDHRAGALAASLEMPPSTVFAFGDPTLGTIMMLENILVGLDLPLKMLVSQDAESVVKVTYEAPTHLRQRYSLTFSDPQLQRAAAALANFASVASGLTVEVTEGDATEIESADGIVTVNSASPASEVLTRLLQAIEDNPQLGVFTQIDHQSAAEAAGLSLGFATVVVFGSAAVGTPLMVEEDSVGLDLPLKMLVAERDGATVVAYSAPEFLALRHGGLSGQQMRIEGMTNALAGLAAAASADPAVADTTEDAP